MLKQSGILAEKLWKEWFTVNVVLKFGDILEKTPIPAERPQPIKSESEPHSIMRVKQETVNEIQVKERKLTEQPIKLQKTNS